MFQCEIHKSHKHEKKMSSNFMQDLASSKFMTSCTTKNKHISRLITIQIAEAPKCQGTWVVDPLFKFMDFWTSFIMMMICFLVFGIVQFSCASLFHHLSFQFLVIQSVVFRVLVLPFIVLVCPPQLAQPCFHVCLVACFSSHVCVSVSLALSLVPCSLLPLFPGFHQSTFVCVCSPYFLFYFDSLLIVWCV